MELITNVEILLPRFADNRSGEHCFATMREAVDPEDGIIVAKRIIAVMVSKGAFGVSLPRRDMTYQGKLCLGHQGMGAGPGTSPQTSARNERRKNQLRDILRQRRHRRENQSRWSPEKHRYRQRMSCIVLLRA